MTDITGNVVWKADYEPFGRVNESIENNFRFPGQYYISETGLYYNWWRWYKSETGRYMEVDPIINPDIIHLPNSPFNSLLNRYSGISNILIKLSVQSGSYLYSRNQPVNLSDKTGLLCYYCCLCYGTICVCTLTVDGRVAEIVIVYAPYRDYYVFDCGYCKPVDRCRRGNWA
jgi:RHS repeat-associated protein